MKAITLLLAVTLPAFSQVPLLDPAADATANSNVESWSVDGDLLIVRVPERRAVRFRRDLADPKRAKEARENLLEMIEKNEAQLVDWPVLKTISGSRSVTQNIQEIRYPIEFSRPNVVTGHFPAGAQPSATATAPETAATKKKGKPAETPVESVVRILAGVPSNFETRNAGVTVELEAVVSPDGKIIAVQIAPEHVIFAGHKPAKIESKGHTVVVEQPEFQTQKTSTYIRLHSGQPVLYSFRKLKEPAGTVELSILTLTAKGTE